MSEPIEYVISCRCGRGLRLGLTEREQRIRALNKSSGILANLFRVFHEEHNTVTGWFGDVPVRGGEIDALQPAAEGDEK